MPVLIGELEKITGSPSSVTQVMVRAHTTRITGSALTTDELVPIPVDRQGRFEVPLRPGKAVLVLVHGGRVGEGERFPMLVEEGLGTITSAIKLASDRFDDYELDELERAAADMLASLDKGLVAARRAEVAKEDAEKARNKAGEHRDDAEKAAGTAAEDAATGAVQKADEKLAGYVTAAEGHAEDSKSSATSAGKDAGRAEAARQGAETIQQGIPTKIDQELETKLSGELDTRVPAELDKHLPGELDERVPPLVASSIADDRAVADAAAAAVVDAVDEAMPSKADTSYVDAQDQALGQRITDETESKADKGVVDQIALDSEDSKTRLFPPALSSTDDLDNVLTPRRYRTASASIAGNPALHYPPGAQHGFLDVIQMSSSYRHQLWIDTFALFIAHRRLISGVWTEWKRVGEEEAQAAVDPLSQRISALEDSPPGESSVTVTDKAAVVYGRNRPDTWAYPAGTDIYWHSPGGMEFVDRDYLGDGYVGILGRSTDYDTMRVKKSEFTGTIDVSCINTSTSRHVTYRIQGPNAQGYSYLDDMQIIEEIWVGAVVDGTPQMDILVSPRSNMEFAFQLDISGSTSWVPHHGTQTAFAAAPSVLTDSDGQPIDVASMSTGSHIDGVNGVKLRQSLYGRHPDVGTENIVRLDVVTTVSPDGMLQTEVEWVALRDVTLQANYGPMTPIEMGVVDQVHVLDGGTYPVDTVPPAVTRYDVIPEGDAAESMLSTGSGGVFVAVAFLDPDETLLRNHPLGNHAGDLRVENRNNGMLKIYPPGLAPGALIPEGTVWRSGAQWRYGEITNPAQYA